MMHAKIKELLSNAQRRLVGSIAVICLQFALVFVASAAPQTAEKEADLKAVRARIDSIRQSLHAEAGRRDALSNQLKNAELDIQSKRQSLAEIRSERRASERQLTELRVEQQKTEQQIAAERQQLAATVRVAYINGRAEQLKLLLNQQDPAQLGRMLTYYGYFGRARADRIASIGDRLAHLELLTERIAAEAERLKQMEAIQVERVGSLAQARQERSRQLAAIQAGLKSRGDQLKRLEREAAGLERLIAELRRAITDFPALAPQAFQKVQGKLPWPVTGKLLARFGSPRSGGPLKWEGILIGAAPGTQVRAPFHGRVIYADWLNGLGLLVVLDHGGGYLSLYGHNEELYRKVGDVVSPGDPLGALAERAAGDQSALYLEIRRGKQPL
ncbi:MAG: peptidoglycan DD-metalloendopeptidase family protein, partial [Candidatus Obscuribacterales bacterium]|nr:peptidoglycan DD-metalloendopeptidase family protein [Steroidobacteraceae bacterium]